MNATTTLPRLPATQIFVPTTLWSVSRISQHETSRGVAFVANVKRNGVKVGTFENDGRGGETLIIMNSADREAFLATAALFSDYFEDFIEALMSEYERKTQLNKSAKKYLLVAPGGDVKGVKMWTGAASTRPNQTPGDLIWNTAAGAWTEV